MKKEVVANGKYTTIETMHKDYKGGATDLEKYYQDAILVEFGIKQPISWGCHVKTGPDNFLHIFSVGDVKYALAFDDYPSGFSVGQDKSVKSMKLADGEAILHVSARDNKYSENITGAFMLFQVIDTEGFEKLVNYLGAAYEKLQRRWRRESKETVMIARDILQLAETAAQNHDRSALHSLQNIVETFARLDAKDDTVAIELLKEYIDILQDADYGYEYYTLEDKEELQDEIYKLLSRDTQNAITIQKYETGVLGQTVRVVNAMYAKTQNGMTEGISAAIVFDDEKISYPMDHFINDELKKYFAENAYITGKNIEHHMPKTLREYRLVEGSVQVRDVFPRELAYLSY